jgi:hypothetical protein
VEAIKHWACLPGFSSWAFFSALWKIELVAQMPTWPFFELNHQFFRCSTLKEEE